MLRDARHALQASPHAEEDGKRARLSASPSARAQQPLSSTLHTRPRPHTRGRLELRQVRARAAAPFPGPSRGPSLTVGRREPPRLYTCAHPSRPCKSHDSRLRVFSTTAFVAPTARIRRYGCRHAPRRFSLPTVSSYPVPPAPLRSAWRQRPAHQGRPSPGYSHFLQGNGGWGNRAQVQAKRPGERTPVGKEAGLAEGGL